MTLPGTVVPGDAYSSPDLGEAGEVQRVRETRAPVGSVGCAREGPCDLAEGALLHLTEHWHCSEEEVLLPLFSPSPGKVVWAGRPARRLFSVVSWKSS